MLTGKKENDFSTKVLGNLITKQKIEPSSINRLIENACAMALKVAQTGDRVSLQHAIDMLNEAHHSMKMEKIDAVLATERAENA